MERLKKENLLNGRPVYLYSTGGTASYSHDLPEISLVLEGSGIHRIGEQEIPCEAGDLYVINTDVTHRFEQEGSAPLKLRHLLFDPDLLSSADCHGVFMDNGAVGYATLTEGSRREIEGFFETITRELAEERYQWREAVGATLSLLLIAVGRYVNDAIKNSPAAKPRELELVHEGRRILEEEFTNPALTLEELAGRLFVSESSLSRLFKRFTGESFSLYLRRKRIEHACRLLLTTDAKVEEIVRQCGLRDVPSFYKVFHEIMGITPAQYRIQNSKGDIIMSILNEISENLQKGLSKPVKELVQKALDESVSPAEILENGLLHGMGIIGERFKNNEIYIPEVLVAARALNTGMQVLKPYLQADGVEAVGKACIGTVQGDMHDIGKNLVKMMMEGKGIEVVDLGTDVAPEAFIAAAKENDCSIICCSALLTTTMPVMKEVVELAKAEGIRDSVKIMVGGAPVNQDFCTAIGADCYTSDAASAADAAAAFLRG